MTQVGTGGYIAVSQELVPTEVEWQAPGGSLCGCLHYRVCFCDSTMQRSLTTGEFSLRNKQGAARAPNERTAVDGL